MSKLPYLFRGQPLGCEYAPGVKYVYGGYYRDDQYEYIITKDARWRVTNVSILAGYDRHGKPVFTGDTLIDEVENEYYVRRDMSAKRIARLKLWKRP